ncbi:alpha/beta fold hydrolase [Breoghania sp. L-A4]|uniref:alpha/beta fold hydrolase n=1 Tax=Breoghania sp. L-A4 TaxID=2304600 RepID=UPI000E35DE48|nr:alpha/beta fold hydrolase [Breoghania sp. L-A4]AXS41681.1 alpha/beta fold hydrolase [Breoghania sp. L-A4]
MMALSETYRESFSRNIGILREAEQERLARATVAVVGTGGIGSNCLVTLARMGVGNFNIVDPDTFELANINRQAGADSTTVGARKVDVVEREILAINPDASVRTFAEKFCDANADAVLGDADICIDAIDFYAIEDHLRLHRAARARGLYILMGSPVGFSASMQVFDPDGMDMETFCGITDDMPPMEKQLRYACSVVPKLAHISYFDVSKGDSNTDFLRGTGPSIASACLMAASLVASEVVLILLERRKPRAIPYIFQFDPYTHRYENDYLDGGMTHYDPSEVLESIPDRGSLVANIFDHFYRKVHAERLPLSHGGSLCYRTEGEGPPVLFLCPVGTDTSFWSRQCGTLNDAFRLITVDNRGAGRSSALPDSANTRDMAGDVIALLDHLGERGVSIVGLALGGLIAQQVALLRPDLAGRLVLVSAYETADDLILRTTAAWREKAAREGMQALFDETIPWVFSEDYRGERADELYKLKTFYRVNRQDAASFSAQTLAGNTHRPAHPLSEIACETLIIHGEQDRLVRLHHADALQRAIAGSELALMRGGAHFMNWEMHEAFNDVLRGFLRREGVAAPQAAQRG